MQTHDRAGTAFGYPEPLAQSRDGSALAVRGQKFPVMMVIGCRPEDLTPKFPGRSSAFREDLSSLGAASTT
ncbi:integrase, catalytic region domain protein [Mycobacterium kansasii 662]|uniref:Integrase, catalytic region domain protein n=1 Tax=Mycobacterium kansasii 662 TaxID=1299326 RepID=X7YU70_MYCKA|nr:integrase, catalytic region domain protein [Mycobacterium kansasii 824]EUA10281.1 integrase, catalytic region domain protein [Mycobacterium kansasii 662]